MMNELLRAENLVCIRGGRVLFENLSLRVESGEAVIVSGANGSGKSSLLRVLAGLLSPASGVIDRPVDYTYLGHDNALKARRTLGDELGWWAALDNGAPLFALGLAGLADVPVRMLSAGQKRRAALGRVMASGVRLWLLDEPGAGLDAVSSAALSAAIEIHRAAGGGVVMATHGETRVAHARAVSL